MAVDLTKLILHTGYNTFKNKDFYSGSEIISGTTFANYNVRLFTVTLTSIPDYYDVVYNGPTAFGVGSDARPANGWGPQIKVWVAGTGGSYTNYPCPFFISSSISGTTLTIRAEFVQSFYPTPGNPTVGLTLTNTTFYYRLIDYSVF
jgi:hypothetical protein